MDRSRLRARIVAGAALVVVAAAALVTSPDAVLSRAAWLVADPIRLVIVTIALAAVRPLLAWPTTLLAVLLGYGLGPSGFPLALALVTLTSVPPYLLARRFGRTGRVADAGEAFREQTGDVRSVVASRLVPAPSDVVSVAAGMAGVPLWAFLLGTAIGEIPWVIVGILAGSSAETLAAGDLAGATDLRVVVAAMLVAVLLLGPTVYGWYADQRTGADGAVFGGDQ
ncbi:VTT domain-containing protein [Halobellus sp. H-GB7]|uniref:TVP38/TMEM64 family protein n=1 Tax=Halobellus sp. H-GB7 TaxID=3069756 RepID=UPI0027AFB822|nr:VTT domain-containing protein [Halobellus sp. H-GB7]MDQ2054693.1 VTT domain-containing protein [Halobellus sp. H-GB7]